MILKVRRDGTMLEKGRNTLRNILEKTNKNQQLWVYNDEVRALCRYSSKRVPGTH